MSLVNHRKIADGSDRRNHERLQNRSMSANQSRPCDISVIIVNWHSKDYLRKCLDAIATTVSSLSYEVIVVDAGSFDGVADMLATFYPQARFVQAQSNIGFASANNRGFQLSSGRLVLFINPDTEVRHAAIDQMAAAAGLRDAGVVGVRLLNADGSVQTSCVQSFPTALNKLIDSELTRRLSRSARMWGNRALFQPISPEPRTVDVISGACMMLRREVFAGVGGFCEEFFMYAEDVDLCHRVRAAGYKNYYLGSAEVVHYGGGSSTQEASAFPAIMMREATRRYFARTRGSWYARTFTYGTLLTALLRLMCVMAAAPIAAVPKGRRVWVRQAVKWSNVIAWSLGVERLSAAYYRDRPAGTSS